MDIKTDHTLNKTFLAGLGGGLALIAVLFVPLYVDWPGRYIGGWTSSPAGLNLVLIILAVLFSLATGYAAPRWAGSSERAFAEYVDRKTGR